MAGGAFGQQNQEFVAAHARGKIGHANGRAEPRGEFLQNQVSYGMPVGVIHLLEIVQIEGHYRQRVPIAAGARGFRRQALLSHAPVAKPRKGIDQRQPLKFFRAHLQDSHFLELLGKLAAQLSSPSPADKWCRR